MRTFIEAGSIFILALIIAFATNAIRNDGLALKGEWSKEAVEKRHLGEDLVSVSIEDAYRMFQKGDAFFIDARSSSEFERGHIKGAWNIPAWEANARIQEIEGLMPQDANIITYCDGEDCSLSRDLARFLKGMGYKNVRVLINGWSLWRKAGYPVERGGV